MKPMLTCLTSRLFFLFLSILLLASCVSIKYGEESTEQAPVSSSVATKAKFDAWSAMSDVPAVIRLVQQTDELIEQNANQQAADKLERLLRIAPDYAPGWSRLAWLSMQSGDLRRARQLADRSNSYAAGLVDLKLLNWSFIRDASLQLNDYPNVQRAERNIEALGNI